MEAERAVTRFGTTGYFTLTMWSCIALLHELRGERAASDRLLARLEGVSWYRRQGRLLVSVKLSACTQEEAESLAVDLLGSAQVQATPVRSRHMLR